MRMDNQKALAVLDLALPFAFFSNTFVNPNDFRSVNIEYFNDTLGIRPNLVNNLKSLDVGEFFNELFENPAERDRMLSELELFGLVENYSIHLKNSSLIDSLRINCGISRLHHGQYFLQGFLSPVERMAPHLKPTVLENSLVFLEALQPTGCLESTLAFDSILGTSTVGTQMKDEIEQIARLNTSVLVTGTLGTGKKLVARAIHEKSGRHEGPFILQSCRDISEDRLDLELFGRPTSGETNESPGLLQIARGGTLVLQEIEDLPLGLQTKLLRALQDGEIRTPGTARYEKVDVRIILTSANDLEPLMRQNQFRDDLYYEICVFSIQLPILKDRQEDIIPLAEHFQEEYNREFGKEIRGIAPLAQILLKDHQWPGNVRELRQVIKHATLICESDMVEAADLVLLDQRNLWEEIPQEEYAIPEEVQEVAEKESTILSKNKIVDTLTKNQWNKTITAKELNMSRATLWRKIKGFSITTPSQPI